MSKIKIGQKVWTINTLACPSVFLGYVIAIGFDYIRVAKNQKNPVNVQQYSNLNGLNFSK